MDCKLISCKRIQQKLFIINQQVELLRLYNVQKYDEELFTILFDLTNKIEIRKICIKLYYKLLSNKVKNICAKIKDKIRSFETKNLISNEVSCFSKTCYNQTISICYLTKKNFTMSLM